MVEDYKYITSLDKLVVGAPSIKIESLFTDSRKKVKNGIFFCVKGLVSDGHNYVKDAVANGAVCIVHSDDLEIYSDKVHYIKVEDVRDALNDVAAAFYDYPSKKLTVYAVTGTNGKTTVSYLVKSILNNFKKTGYIGTISIEYDNHVVTSTHTTPDVLELQSILAKMVDSGIEAVAIEVSSHAITQKRVQALEVDYAIFTNLSHEHLDYHGTMTSYFNSKSQLFSSLSQSSCGIINIDDDYGFEVTEKNTGKNITYSMTQPADYQAVDIEYSIDSTSFNLLYKDKKHPITTNLVAKFNIYNLLSVIAVLVESNIELEALIPYLKNLDQVDGRVEKIDLGQNFTAIVDYAHTPDGFEKIFQYAKEIKGDKRIIAVFGSAGERDIIKRKILGEIADKYSDMIILTEDDPRKEDVSKISNQIAEGIEGNYVIIENRYDAIYQAIELANTDDVILLLGKGNDQYMARQTGNEYYAGDGEILKQIINEYIIDYTKQEY